MVSSQFLYSYTDQLVRSDLVDWVEGPLSSVPEAKFRKPRGFQDMLGVTSAGPRTRAGEAYKLGLLTGRLVREQGDQGIPLGWESVIEGQLPLTRLGKYSYIIGRALRDGDGARLENALDDLACSQILHVGFEVDGRWYCTVAIAQFAKSQIEEGLGRNLTDEEIRYLSGAVVNTLDSPNRSILLKPYVEGSDLETLLFDVEDEGERFFAPLDLEGIVANDEIDKNGIVKRKAALFWAQPDRGIFSRATRSDSYSVVQEFVEVDRWLARKGDPNPLSPMLDKIDASQYNPGIFRVATEQFSEFGDLLKEWERYESNLFDLVNASAEGAQPYELPTAWRNIQLSLRATQDEERERKIPVDELDEGTDALPVDEMSGGENEDDETAEVFDATEYLEESFDSVLQEPPAPTKTTSKTKPATKVGKPNYEARDAANRELGCAGELFVVEYERAKLRNAGKPELADKIEWVSKEIGDGLGYDITSFDVDGMKIQIEVKTTNSGKATPFIISPRELTVWEEKHETYRLYRVYSFKKAPKLFVIEGNPRDLLQLEAINYRARI